MWSVSSRSNQNFHPRLFPSKKTQIRLLNNHSQHVCGQWCGSKTFTFTDRYVTICFSALILALSALAQVLPKPFSFFKVCFLTEEMDETLHSFTPRAVEQDVSADLRRHWRPGHTLSPTNHHFPSSFCFFFFSYLNIRTERSFISLAERALVCGPRLFFAVTFKLGTPRCFVDIFFLMIHFSIVQNLSQNEHSSAFTWQVHCAISTNDFSSVPTRCPNKLLFCLLGSFNLFFPPLFTECSKTLELLQS